MVLWRRGGRGLPQASAPAPAGWPSPWGSGTPGRISGLCVHLHVALPVGLTWPSSPEDTNRFRSGPTLMTLVPSNDTRRDPVSTRGHVLSHWGLGFDRSLGDKFQPITNTLRTLSFVGLLRSRSPCLCQKPCFFSHDNTQMHVVWISVAVSAAQTLARPHVLSPHLLCSACHMLPCRGLWVASETWCPYAPEPPRLGPPRLAVLGAPGLGAEDTLLWFCLFRRIDNHSTGIQ